MNDLDKVLQELADADRDRRPSPSVEDALIEQMRSRRRAAGPLRWAAAAVLALTAGAAWLAVRDDPPPSPAVAQRPQPAATEFYVLQTGRPLSEMRSGRLMRVTLPASAPIYFGLPPLPPGSGVDADILVGDDGVAQAVRFVY